jgi:3-hydroxyisobutyrate dehydrogenase
MCRSVMIKGLEDLVIESFTAARAYGVEDAVVASLAETFPGIDWERQGTYFFQRAIEHGRRRAEEMREVAVTVADTGLDPLSATSTAVRHDWVADLAAQRTFTGGADWRLEADHILKHLARE